MQRPAAVCLGSNLQRIGSANGNRRMVYVPQAVNRSHTPGSAPLTVCSSSAQIVPDGSFFGVHVDHLKAQRVAGLDLPLGCRCRPRPGGAGRWPLAASVVRCGRAI